MSTDNIGIDDVFSHAFDEWVNANLDLSEQDMSVVAGYINFAHEMFRNNQPIGQDNLQRGLALRFQDGLVLSLVPEETEQPINEGVEISRPPNAGGIESTPSQRITDG